jgi:hypothetical protein
MADKESKNKNQVSKREFDEMKRYMLEVLATLKQETPEVIAYRTQSLMTDLK